MADYPEKGELVIASVERVVGYGAFVKLGEYGDKQGMVSIKEFSRKWVKNPRDYLKEGQKTVLKVLRVNPEREHIDLSLKVVNDNERRNKLKDYKLEIRVGKLIEHLAEKMKKKPADLQKEFGDKLAEDYGTLYDAFAEVANDNEDLKEYIKDDKLRADVIKMVQENIKPTLVTITGFVTLHSEASDGVESLKAAILAGAKTFPKGVEGTIHYVSPPDYRIDIIADDYKTAEKALKDCHEAIGKYAASKGFEAQFNRELKKAS